MSTRIRRVCQGDINAVTELSLAAWPKAHESFKNILGPQIFYKIWPNWRKSQKQEVTEVCRASIKPGSDITTWVAEVDGRVAGFIDCKLNRQDKTGEVEYLAVHPKFQGSGVGIALNRHALRYMKREGIVLAHVETGGDLSHAAARRVYEKAGYTGLPLVRYYKYLGE